VGVEKGSVVVGGGFVTLYYRPAKEAGRCSAVTPLQRRQLFGVGSHAFEWQYAMSPFPVER
jgi:hypothetical protein